MVHLSNSAYFSWFTKKFTLLHAYIVSTSKAMYVLQHYESKSMQDDISFKTWSTEQLKLIHSTATNCNCI